MTAEPRSDSSWLCPSCDAEPPPGLREPVCPSCGAKLIEVRSRAKDLAGQVIDGRFEIRDLLGEGGMGSVYRAWQRSIGREVAIKLIDDRHARDPMAVRRFLREARLASQLSQPNTVSVFDFGQSSDGRLFIAMELIRGRTLADVLEQDGPFPMSRAAWIGVQLCDALDAAHRLKIVHRDLKPANVVLLDDPPGRDLIKVLDFGLAKSLTESETKATDTGLVVGTPRYMAPEVVMGEAPTAQSDLYAVGVILAELATGKVLWEATSFPALAGQKMHTSPIIHEVPAGLRAVVSRLIDPEPHRRPADASDVRGLLRPLVISAETPVPFTGPARALVDADTPRPGRAPVAPTEPTVPHIKIATPPRAVAAVPSAASTSPVVADAPTLTAPATVDSLAISAVRPTSGPGWAMIALLLALVFAILGVIVIASRGRDDRAPDRGSGAATGVASGAVDAAAGAPPLAADAAVAALVDAGAPPAATVTFAVRSKPDHAAVTIDGRPAGTTPVDVAVPLGTAGVVVQVEAGGRTARQVVVPDRARTVTLTIRRAVTGDGMPF